MKCQTAFRSILVNHWSYGTLYTIYIYLHSGLRAWWIDIGEFHIWSAPRFTDIPSAIFNMASHQQKNVLKNALITDGGYTEACLSLLSACVCWWNRITICYLRCLQAQWWPVTLFTKRTDLLPSNLVKTRSGEIGCYNDHIGVKFNR